MLRYYKLLKPSANKAAAPVAEIEITPEKAEKPSKKQKDETDGQ